MNVLERMRTAWAAPDRTRELNRTTEALAAEGATRDELDEALGALLDEVRAAGADDATEEIINEVGDRLHGWCVGKRLIVAHQAALPSLEEVLHLPRWARVALAARCLRRLLVAAALAPNTPDVNEKVENAIGTIERVVVTGRGDDLVETWGQALIASKAYADRGLELQAAVANTVYHAALLGWGEGYIRLPDEGTVLKSQPVTVWNQSAQIARAVGVDLTQAIRSDYEMLMAAAHEHGWAEEAHLPAWVIEKPLGSNGKLSDWPNNSLASA